MRAVLLVLLELSEVEGFTMQPRSEVLQLLPRSLTANVTEGDVETKVLGSLAVLLSQVANERFLPLDFLRRAAPEPLAQLAHDGPRSVQTVGGRPRELEHLIEFSGNPVLQRLIDVLAKDGKGLQVLHVLGPGKLLFPGA